MQVEYMLPHAQPSTSPWTEAYHNAPAAQSSNDAPKMAFDTETQPTRDALSDIYNRGYDV